VLARYYMSKDETQNAKMAHELGKASYLTSVVGIVVAVIVIFIVLIAVSRHFITALASRLMDDLEV